MEGPYPCCRSGCRYEDERPRSVRYGHYRRSGKRRGRARHENPEQAVAYVEEFVTRSLRELYRLGPEELRDQRYERFRAF